MFLNFGAGEDSWEFLGEQGYQTNLKRKQPWIFIGRTDAEVEAPILWSPDAKSWLLFPDFIREKTLMLRKTEGRGEGSNIERDCWMASPTQWTWVCANSESWWWTGRPGVLQFMRSQRVGHDWATKLNWTCYLLIVLSAKPWQKVRDGWEEGRPRSSFLWLSPWVCV